MKNKPLFFVKKPGVYSSFQDLGRWGYQQYGVVVSGAMDSYALQVGNLLVGNERNEAGIEVTLKGPELEIQSTFQIAITGADLSPTLNGEPAPMWKSFEVAKGDVLSFGAPKKGIRAYITVAGGFDVPITMGSKSTYEKAGIGKALKKEDRIEGFETTGKAGIGLVSSEIPDYKKEVEIHVVLGPHQDYFTDEAIHTFFTSVHTVSAQSDRMGYRLDSPKIEHKSNADIYSDAIPLGGIQIPASGQPIILMADRQTTGGYTRIGTVISSDISKLAQLPPGGKIRFKEATVEEAKASVLEIEQELSQIAVRAGVY
ncbi:biotin-dependent carboxyltransferase family protein [Pseudalkalibacillus caeni]|uniref:Biotin-dependent carboxyltransferase n=1 Tax=Exobacillus caeni TaxID=2574798 RepID=A0A5R9F4P1_9BACL|nr:biotin-dependent carboxyltransferase family protein [Pseudalkalibacillus caeni]TLS36608.1 biotin-dependent carboxyltransferase [Pseudalkalibacillus caeni]